MKLKFWFLLFFYIYVRESNELVCYSTDETRWNLHELHEVLKPANLVDCNGDNEACCYREENYAFRERNGTISQYEKVTFSCLKKDECKPSGKSIHQAKRQLTKYLRSTKIKYDGKILLYKMLGVPCHTDACIPSVLNRSKRQQPDTALPDTPIMGGAAVSQEDSQAANVNVNIVKRIIKMSDIDVSQPQELGYRPVAEDKSHKMQLSIINLCGVNGFIILRYLQLL